MSKEMLDYIYKCNEVLKKANVIVLATTNGQKVYTRAVSVCYYQGDLYFQTSIHSKKYQQLIKNNNGAFTLKFVNFSAQITDVGTWKENSKLLKVYLKNHENSYKNYGKDMDERVMKIKISNATIYEYLENNVNRISCNLTENRVSKEFIKKIQE